MTTALTTRALILAAVLEGGLLAIGCHGHGQGFVLPSENGHTVLAFTDDCGDPLLQTGRLAGFIVDSTNQKQAFLLRPGMNGTVTLDLMPGTYEVHARFAADPTKDPLPIDQSFTVTDTGGGFVTIGSNDPRLDAGWSHYRARDFAGAKTAFTALLGEGVNPGAVSNGLGWTNGQLGLIGDSSSNFQSAQGTGCIGTDALVGYAGLSLLTPSTANADQAEQLLTEALSRGNYHSTPTHDNVTTPDLYVCRALAKYIAGDKTGARADLELARPDIGTDQNFAGQDLFNLLDLQLKN